MQAELLFGFGVALVHLGQFNLDRMFWVPPSVEAMVQIASNFSVWSHSVATGKLSLPSIDQVRIGWLRAANIKKSAMTMTSIDCF